MSFNFHIPLSFRDLLKSGGIGQYVVQEVLPLRQLESQLSAFQSSFRAEGPLAVLQHFDALYSIVHHFRSLDTALKEDILDVMVKVTSRHASELPAVLEDLSLPQPQRNAHLNTLKMTCFLLTQLTEAFEAETYKAALGNVEPTGKGKKTKSKMDGFNWEMEREKVLQTLTHLLQLDLRRLWSMSVVEEEFVSMVTGCCYKMMENPNIGLAKNKSVRDALGHLLGVMVKRYNHMLSASVKVIQLLQHFEHLASVLVQAVSLWATEYGMKPVVGEIMREIGQKCSQDLSRESSGIKAIAAFLTELSERIPAIMMPSISVLLDYLDGDNYMMRNAVLTVMGEMVIRVLSGDQLEEAERNTRDQFLDTLQEHIHDVHTFVRSCVLQIYNKIVQEKALPLTRFQSVVTLVVGRLFDKSVNVCKNAIQLLASFLANNPFTCKLSSADLREPLEKEITKLKELKEKLQEKRPVVVISPEEEWEAMFPEVQEAFHVLKDEEVEGDVQDDAETPEELCEQILLLLRKTSYKNAILLVQRGASRFPGHALFVGSTEDEAMLGILEQIFLGKLPGSESTSNDEDDSAKADPSEESSEQSNQETQSADLKKLEMLVQYLTDAYNFSVKIEEAIDVISKMMYETAVSVVQEVIEFFVTVSQFGVSQAVLGIRRMLPLVWSKEPGVREAVLSAFRRLYLCANGESDRVKAQDLVRNLSLLMVDSSAAMIQCLEEIVSEFITKGEIRPSVIQLLWEKFTQKSACSPLERQAAVMLLGMMSRGQPEIVVSNLDTLVAVALGDNVQEDYQLARDVCNSILKITDGQKSSIGKSGTPFRLPKDHSLFVRLTAAVAGGIGQPGLYWLPFKETAVKLVYELAEEPDEICAEILQRCSRIVLEQLDSQEGSTLPAFHLTHLLSLAGDIALLQVVYLERAVSSELRRRRVLKEEQEAEKLGSGKQSKSKGNESTMEEELGLAGASADDIEADLIRKICDTELLGGQQYLSAFLPLVLQICSNPGKYSDPDLSTVATLTLAKYMMISSDFCDSHLRLLFTVLEKSPFPRVRSNIMIALGDLSIRFPNLIEPWTPHLYARLRDPSRDVRKSSSLVMTHLILKDMVKVKGQVSEMAVLLIDPDQEISSLARNFFNELANKGNSVYNLLPDIISRLSDPDCGVEEEAFRTIMKQLLSYITKDKQTESLVEKMCHRFRTARTERQWRDLAHCLSLLPFSEKGLRKMQDCFDCYGDKLSDDDVYNSFLNAVGKMRRGAKPELKTLIDEFEQKLRKCHNKGLENMDGPEEQIPEEPQSARKNPTTKRRPMSSINGTQKPKDDFQTPKPATRKNTRKHVVVTFSSDEESDLEAELSEAETPKNPTPIRRTSTRSRAK
ncbi:condensin complex subunit 1 isoform X2 [Spea bombifrons]|uniref:condensin complex subunit 1 isoform X2 n=1 Tax=Spea bombifrons TaxID=233779 RepID=UPI00234B0D71|nr:condensin complex subunit 1 isoform X2 [Spea bombifrons]